MINHISTQLREIQMQLYKCNKYVCVLNDIDAQKQETHMHGNKYTIYEDACKCVCALNLFKNQGQVVYLLKLLILKSPWEVWKLINHNNLSYPLHINPNVVCHEISQSISMHLQSPPLAIS